MRIYYKTSYFKGYENYYIALIRKTIRTEERGLEKFRRASRIRKNSRRKKNQTDFERNRKKKLKKRIPDQS